MLSGVRSVGLAHLPVLTVKLVSVPERVRLSRAQEFLLNEMNPHFFLLLLLIIISKFVDSHPKM